MDALLGAAALGDIGQHFPPVEPQYKDISSLTLLEKVKDRLDDGGWRINNIDATVIAEEPRLTDFIGEMRQNISQKLNIKLDEVSVKASTASRLGCIGKGKGIEARAVALIESASNQAGNMINLALKQIGLMAGFPEQTQCDCPPPQSDGAADSTQEGGKTDVTD
jgi:2-C-methyl-D-erythritol 2,4-cyclodiphosphate synthase